MTSDAMDRLLEMSMRISLEKNFSHLLKDILEAAMSLANCDGGALYLKNGSFLEFKVLYNHTLKCYWGADGKKISLPPIPFVEAHKCSQALLRDEVLTIGSVKDCEEPVCLFTALYDFWVGYDPGSVLVVPMKSRKGELIGALQLINAKDDDGKTVNFSAEDIILVKSAASQAAVSIQNVRYLEEIKELFASFVKVLSTAIDERIPFNATHTRNMVRYGERFIDYLNQLYADGKGSLYFSEGHKEELIMSIWLHDIGKLVLPLEVLNKAFRLEPAEQERIRQRFEIIGLRGKIALLEKQIEEAAYEQLCDGLHKASGLLSFVCETEKLKEDDVERLRLLAARTYQDDSGEMKNWLTQDELEKLCVLRGTLSEPERLIVERHVVMTEKLLSQIHFSEDYKNVSYWASMHHEFLDGTGYPKRLSGKEIPAEVRILTILDIFDAMTAEDRPYKTGIPVQKTLDTLKTMAEEGKLDSELVSFFINSRCWEA